MKPLFFRGLLPLLAGTMLLSSCADESITPDPPSDVTLAAPPADKGFQIVVGPFDVPVGKEIQNNFYRKLPNDAEIYVNKIEFKYNTGSHHLNLFKSNTDIRPDTVIDSFNPVDFDKWDMVAASQTGSFTWQLPEGVAIKLDAKQQMNFQTHFVNAGTQSTPTGRGKAIVNFWTTDKAKVTSLSGAVFSNNKKLNILPKTSATYCKVVPAFDKDVQIMLMTGHYHSRGKTFVAGHWDTGKQQLRDTIYKNSSWDEPPVVQFNPAFTLTAGDSLGFITTFENRTDQLITFGGKVETMEHANLFFFYYPGPADGKAVYDYEGGFLMESHSIQ